MQIAKHLNHLTKLGTSAFLLFQACQRQLDPALRNIEASLTQLNFRKDIPHWQPDQP